MDCSTPGFPVFHHLLEFVQTHVHRVGDAIQPSHPLLSPSLPAFNLSQHQDLFQWANSSHEVAKILQFQLQHQSFQWIFRTDFLEGWLVWSPCSLRNSQESSPTPQFKSINYLALSFLYSPISISIHDHALTRQTFVGKVMSLLFTMLSRLVIAFLPRSKHLLISWLQSPSAVILEPPKIKSDTVSIVSPSIFYEMMGPDAMIFVFIKRLFSSSLLSAVRMVSSMYLRLLIFILAILIPACASSSPVFLMMYSACKLNKQGDNIQP